MNTQIFKNAVALAEQRQHLLISTTDMMGIPHIASVGSFEHLADNQIALDDWHCPATLHNLQNNGHIALVVWDIATDFGYQLMGEVEAIRPSTYTTNPHDHELVVRINKVLSFSHASHPDTEPDEKDTRAQTDQIGLPEQTQLAEKAHWHRTYAYLR